MKNPFDHNTAVSGLLDKEGYVTSLPCKDAVPSGAVTFVACGDTAPVRNLEQIAVAGCSAEILGEMLPVLDSADFVFANIEATFSNRGEPLNRVPVFRLDPSAVDLVRQAKIKIASLANNHMFDYGPEAFVDTVDLLHRHEVQVFGAGLSMTEALQPAIFDVKGINFGFVGFRDRESKSHPTNGVHTPQAKKELILEQIDRLKGTVDWIVVSLHFGLEYRTTPRPDDIRLCRELIDYGAHLILGHHPHYPQGFEVYNDGLIVYSLGNFVWDQNFVGHTASSYVMQISVSKSRLQAVRVIPFCLGRDYKIRLDQSGEALAEIERLSSLLHDEPALERAWYFITRDHFQLFMKEMKKKIVTERQSMSSIVKWWRNHVGPRSKETLKDFLKYACMFSAVRYEFERMWQKQRK